MIIWATAMQHSSPPHIETIASAMWQAIASEKHRDRVNFAAVDRLRAALSHIGV
ncbi:hypothetical protein ACQKLX_07175 [Bosea sp. NPDC003192]|uniref:hypothetical protein n=1 Tax=Bosea sp. NPDC003192 TaxID=3390551 RepID=UPI003CFFEFAC